MNPSMYLAARRIDIADGEAHVAVIHRLDAEQRGFHIGDKL